MDSNLPATRRRRAAGPPRGRARRAAAAASADQRGVPAARAHRVHHPRVRHRHLDVPRRGHLSARPMRRSAVAALPVMLAACALGGRVEAPELAGPTLVLEVTNGSDGDVAVGYEFEAPGTWQHRRGSCRRPAAARQCRYRHDRRQLPDHCRRQDGLGGHRPAPTPTQRPLPGDPRAYRSRWRGRGRAAGHPGDATESQRCDPGLRVVRPPAPGQARDGETPRQPARVRSATRRGE